MATCGNGVRTGMGIIPQRPLLTQQALPRAVFACLVEVAGSPMPGAAVPLSAAGAGPRSVSTA